MSEVSPTFIKAAESRLAEILTDWRFMTTIAAIGGILLASVTCHWPYNRVILSIETEGLLLSANDRTDLRPDHVTGSTSGRFLIAGASSIENLPPSAVAKPGESADISATAQVRLSAIHLIKGTLLRLGFASGPTLDLLVRGHGRVEIESPPGRRTFRHVGGPDVVAEEENEPLTIVAVAQPGPVPLHIQLPVSDKTAQITFSEPIAVDLLRFGVDRSGREAGPAFRSGILKGSLRMLDTGREIQLRPHEPLSLEGLQGMLHFTKISSDHISIEFAGTTTDVLVGSPGFELRLTPTVLEFVESRAVLQLLWGTLVVVLGALWGARTWLSSARDG
jgi:hypothetical protein